MNQNEERKLEKSPGQLAYERDLSAQPHYDGGARRPGWDQLGDVAKSSWERNPTDRKPQGNSPAGNNSIADRLVVTVDQADGNNVLVALAPEGISEQEASDAVRTCASENAEYSDLMQDLTERGFVVFSRFMTVDIE